MPGDFTVLYIEDNPGDVELVTRLLGFVQPTSSDHERFNVLSAARVSDAVALLQSARIDIILLDLGLPDSHGLDDVQIMMRSAPEVPVVVLSQNDDDSIALDAVRAGAQDYLLKENLQPELLNKTIGYALERSRHGVKERKLIHRLEANEEAIQSILHDSPDAIFLIDKHGIIRFTNPACEGLFGQSTLDLIGSAADFIVDNESGSDIEISRPNGDRVFAEMRVTETDWRGEKMHLASLRDITERRQSESAARLAAEVFSQVSDGIMITDKDANIMMVNKGFTTITGFSEKEVIGKSASVLSSGRHRASFFENLWSELVEHGRWEGDIWNRRVNGEAFPIRMSISTIRDDADVPANYVGVFWDISLRKKLEEQLRDMAMHDPLTHLVNRNAFDDRINHAIERGRRRGERMAVLMVDLDHFKKINDTLGHAQGDKVLVEATQRLKACARKSDTVGRLGGDEFVLLMEDIKDTEDAPIVAKRVVASLSSPFICDGREFKVGASVGVSLFPEHGDEPTVLLRRADEAMYRAKAHRGSYIIWGGENTELDILDDWPMNSTASSIRGA